MSVGVLEKRWRESSGERYLKDGVTPRCQGISRVRFRAEKERLGNHELQPEQVWPDLQCTKRAEPGNYGCKFHKGTALSVRATSVIDLGIPVDLKEKMEIILENPDYISRKEEMVLLKSRIWQLVEELEELGGAEAWEEVMEGVRHIERGETPQGLRIIRNAAASRTLDAETWKEVRETVNLLQSVTNTEVKSAKELAQMATTEQVMALISRISDALIRGSEKYITNQEEARRLLTYVSAEIAKATNTGSGRVLS